MRKETGFFVRCALPLLLAACDLIGSGGLPDRSRAETEIRRRQPTDDTTAVNPEDRPEVLWISGVEYPEGYDWQRDTAYGKVDARLVLLRDGIRVLEIPAGERQEISTDPDMHRIIGGHLYTDYSTGTETVIRCDGRELFRFSGREMMVGFLVRGEIVWTLGTDRAAGKGLFLRRNGVTVWSDPDGLLPPGFGNPAFEGGLLHMDGNEMFFYYRTSRGWFQVHDRTAELVALPAGITDVHDIRHIGGEIVVAGKTDGWVLIIARDEEGCGCDLSSLDTRNVAILPVGSDGFLVRGDSVRWSSVTPTLWNPDGSIRLMSPEPVLGFFADGEHAVRLAAGTDGVPVRYVLDGEETLIDGRNHFISSRCALLHDGTFYLLLTPMDRQSAPFLLKDGVPEEIPVRGFLTGMTLTR